MSYTIELPPNYIVFILCLAFALILNCYTTATGNSVTGYFITVFYNAVGDVEPTFECGINNNNREICMLYIKYYLHRIYL